MLVGGLGLVLSALLVGVGVFRLLGVMPDLARMTWRVARTTTDPICLPLEASSPQQWYADECADRQQYGDLLMSSAENSLMTKTKKVKALFWSDYFYYTHVMSRAFFHMYEAASVHPSWEAHVWGPGFPGHRQLCYCRREGDTGEEWKTKDRVVECEAPGDTGRTDVVEGLFDDVLAKGVRSEDLKACKSFKLLSFAQHLEVLFNADKEPFDLIIGDHMRGLRDRPWDPYFVGLSNYTVLVCSGDEVNRKTLDIVRKSRAAVVLHPYVDHYEENYFHREWARQEAPKGNKGAQLFFADPVEEVEHSFAEAIDRDVLVAYAPHGTLPYCSEDWKDVASSSARAVESGFGSVHALKDSQKLRPEVVKLYEASEVREIIEQAASMDALDRVEKQFPINVLGFFKSWKYPTRDLANEANKRNITGMADRIVRLTHPGYTQQKPKGGTFPTNSNCADFLKQTTDRYELLNKMMYRSKICFVGIRSTWSLRKYIEAMAAGCLVVGDVPTNHALKDYVVDLNVTYPGFYNPLEVNDVAAVAKLTGKKIRPSAVASKPKHGVILNNGLYGEAPHDAAKLVAERLASILEDYDRGAYDEQIAAARRYALQQASYTRWLTDWLLPAVEAYRAGERGWLRTPRYIRNHGRKHETRHRYVLTEWLLRKEGLSAALAAENEEVGRKRKMRMSALLATPYEEFLDACEERLKAEYVGKCREREVCEHPDIWYYDGVSDFDVKFVAARKLFSSRVPIDRHSMSVKLVPSLYEEFSLKFDA